MKKCIICTSRFSNEDKTIGTCSRQCMDAESMLGSGVDLVKNTKPTDDARIFFYPLSFGRIIDVWSILCLKRAHIKSIAKQQEIDYQIFKATRSIQTNLGQIVYQDNQRESIRKTSVELFCVNARLWRLRDFLLDKRMEEENKGKEILEWFGLSRIRDEKIRTLDILLTGRSLHFRVINGQAI